MFSWFLKCLLGERDAPSTVYVNDVITKSKYKLTLRLALLRWPYKSRVWHTGITLNQPEFWPQSGITPSGGIPLGPTLGATAL